MSPLRTICIRSYDTRYVSYMKLILLHREAISFVEAKRQRSLNYRGVRMGMGPKSIGSMNTKTVPVLCSRGSNGEAGKELPSLAVHDSNRWYSPGPGVQPLGRPAPVNPTGRTQSWKPRPSISTGTSSLMSPTTGNSTAKGLLSSAGPSRSRTGAAAGIHTGLLAPLDRRSGPAVGGTVPVRRTSPAEVAAHRAGNAAGGFQPAGCRAQERRPAVVAEISTSPAATPRDESRPVPPGPPRLSSVFLISACAPSQPELFLAIAPESRQFSPNHPLNVDVVLGEETCRVVPLPQEGHQLPFLTP